MFCSLLFHRSSRKAPGSRSQLSKRLSPKPFLSGMEHDAAWGPRAEHSPTLRRQQLAQTHLAQPHWSAGGHHLKDRPRRPPTAPTQH